MTQPGLENERCGNLVDHFAAGCPVLRRVASAGTIEEGMGIGRGVAFVNEFKGWW